ncbi:LGFP repeat-containing protein [Nocardia sp. CA-128927]|uniref:LGFP repeat-containing protein n=1 Tax=Nocardia sp. CA-128927 TaxID=3239975 RepID=UPI003D975D2F
MQKIRQQRRRRRLGVLTTMIVAALSVGLVTPVDASARRIGSYDVYGAIEVEYDQAGGFKLFGNPANAESDAARGGRWQAFDKGSSIYWHPRVSNGHANQVGGAIRDKWRDLNWENGTLKYPTTRESATRKPGRFNHFEGGSIYWSGNTGAHSSWGLIRDKWAEHNWEAGPLGFPATDEFKGKNNGAGQHFESGSVYWSGNTGAHSSWGLIRDKWAEHNWEAGPLGFPATDEFKGNNNGAGQHFDGGSVYWSGNTGAHSVWGMTRDHWAQNGWENKQYGYPSSDEYKNQEYEDGYRQDFQGGDIQVVDMKVPAYGYREPSPTARDGGGERPSGTTPPSASGTKPTTPKGATPNDTESRTWPFGDFCVLGTYGGPGGGCRFGDGVSWKDGKCMAAIVLAAGSLALPAAKIAQFRKFVKAVGGAKEAYELWRGASIAQDRAKAWEATGKISLSEPFSSLSGSPDFAIL